MRRSFRFAIILAIFMIVLLAVLSIGWVLLTVFGAWGSAPGPGFYWVTLPVGTTFIGLLILGVVLYLVLSIKSINLNRRQSNFIDSVTHELKSPIASMKLCLQTLKRRQVSRPEQVDFHRFMLEDLERLDHLINQMLDAGRLETGHVDGDTVDVDVGELLHECSDTVCLSYRVPAETVRLDVAPCVVRARRLDLEMIFRNLIDNAVKYAGAQPEVQVTLRTTPDGGTVTQISDNGRGIPPKLRRKIFSRFVRLGLELQREKPGTGLGLYIVRTAVRRLGGRIKVHDRQRKSGTVFEVHLPPGEPARPENNNEKQ